METKLPANIEEALGRLNEDQLKLLNQVVVERLKLLYKAKSLKHMAKFSTGDRVSFVDNDGDKVYGRIIRLNQKTVSILTEDNHRWNVAPSLLTLDSKVYNEPDLFESGQHPEQPAQERNVTPKKQSSGKVSRNAPCPCGSGKKYKRCCG